MSPILFLVAFFNVEHVCVQAPCIVGIVSYMHTRYIHGIYQYINTYQVPGTRYIQIIQQKHIYILVHTSYIHTWYIQSI